MSAKPTTLDLNAVEAVEVVPDDGEHENMFRLVIKQESKKFKGLYSYACASAIASGAEPHPCFLANGQTSGLDPRPCALRQARASLTQWQL